MGSRACDACRRRKIKCQGAGVSCRNCQNAGLSCTFDSVPKKKGPKGTNASVLQELRTSTTKKPPLPLALLQDCIKAYYQKLYFVLPILPRDKFSGELNYDDMPLDRYCLLSTLCAMANIQVLNRPADELIRNTLRTRQTFDYIESPSIDSVHTSFFLFACFFGLNIHNTAWYYLREAITFAQLNGLDSEHSYTHLEPQDAAFRRRTFWLLFVTERAYAIQRHHSLSMEASIDLPSTISIELQENMSGFNYMVDLYSHIDSTFISSWNDTRFNVTHDWVMALHYRLKHAVPDHLDTTDIQEADILVSKQWLRTILWQLSTSKMLLSSTAANEALTFLYPIEISRDLLMTVSRISQPALEVHGVGICEKVFEVASTLTDVMACYPGTMTNQFHLGASDYLTEMIKMLHILRDGTSPWLHILLEKVNQSLPSWNTGTLGQGLLLNSSSTYESACIEKENETTNEPMTVKEETEQFSF